MKQLKSIILLIREVAAQRPVLQSVKDNLDQIKQTWTIEYPSYFYDASVLR